MLYITMLDKYQLKTTGVSAIGTAIDGLTSCKIVHSQKVALSTEEHSVPTVKPCGWKKEGPWSSS